MRSSLRSSGPRPIRFRVYWAHPSHHRAPTARDGHPKKLIGDEETGAKSYRYVRTGTNHYSLAFTYDWIASEQERRSSGYCFIHVLDDDDDEPRAMQELLRHMRNEGLEWPIRWGKKVF